MNHYFLWVVGEDHPGFVAAITKRLFDLRCNLEDSSMMRVGSEFAMFLILSSPTKLTEKDFSQSVKKFDVSIGIKHILERQAKYLPPNNNSFIVRVHGRDQAGIVYRVTQALAANKFNITDLSTHRTTGGKTPGFVLMLEGELPRGMKVARLKKDLTKLAITLNTKITIDPLDAQPI